MRSIRHGLAGITAFALLAVIASAPRADEDYQEFLQRNIQGHWKELGDRDIWWDFAPDLVVKTNHDGKAYRYIGFRLNANVSPAWLDLLYKEDDQVKMALGIALYRGERLVWVEGEHVDAKRWALARGNLPGRPEDFNLPKESKAIRHVLVRPIKNSKW